MLTELLSSGRSKVRQSPLDFVGQKPALELGKAGILTQPGRKNYGTTVRPLHRTNDISAPARYREPNIRLAP